MHSSAALFPSIPASVSFDTSAVAHAHRIGVIDTQSEVQHCTVVFRIPGSREATREFLTDLGTKFPGHEPEIIAIQIGNGLEGKGRTV
ncbi:hypothetical protein [Pseudomonas sp. PIC25]|uniref:hypothetical protein n=1 Tax=Pseudomonas sp. PIC25 TaxID=1958773 RepID=UPI000BABD534|nr:hypothetical protein [Pseudomonas sp. PIC25]